MRLKEMCIAVGRKINFRFDCYSTRVVYPSKCRKFATIYVDSTITPFRKIFNNHVEEQFITDLVKGISGENYMRIFFLTKAQWTSPMHCQDKIKYVTYHILF